MQMCYCCQKLEISMFSVYFPLPQEVPPHFDLHSLPLIGCFPLILTYMKRNIQRQAENVVQNEEEEGFLPPPPPPSSLKVM